MSALAARHALPLGLLRQGFGAGWQADGRREASIRDRGDAELAGEAVMASVMMETVRQDGISTIAQTERGGEPSRRDSLVIIPTYNEAGNLAALVRRVLAMSVFDTLVVDDGSPDGTGDLADQLATEFPGQMQVIHRQGKLGLGSAYRQAFAYALRAGYERIFQMDADFSHDPGRLAALRDALDHADVALGSRYVPGGGARNWPAWRRCLSQGGSAYAALVLGLSLHDLTSGFKGFRRQALETLNVDSIHSTGYSFQIEVTYRCHQRGLRIVEVPITFENRRVGESKMSGHIVLEAFLMVWRLRFDSLWHRRTVPWSSLPSSIP
jgi:dolichol-phosphate mannosyltransferase